ncbi:MULTISPECIES: hypothetical protein [Micromonospora]|nr:hypothetical protein [Micromonospora tulbaghiae]
MTAPIVPLNMQPAQHNKTTTSGPTSHATITQIPTVAALLVC